MVSSGTAEAKGEINQVLQEVKEKIKKLEDSLKEFQKFETKVDYELGNLRFELKKTSQRIESLEEELKKTENMLREELKKELLSELQEEIEHLEEIIERRKRTEVEEFLEVIKAAITLQPEN